MEVLNRKQRRTLERLIKSFEPTNDDHLQDGDRVRLNVKRIKSRKSWKNDELQMAYREFVEDNADVVFTVRRYGNTHTYEFIEDPKWLFVREDLIKV